MVDQVSVPALVSMPIPFKEPATEHQIVSLLIYQDQDYLAKHPFEFKINHPA